MKDEKESPKAIHKIELTITDNLSVNFIPKGMYNWFDSGGLAGPQSSMISGYSTTVLMQEKVFVFKGCSGFIVYESVAGEESSHLYIAVSNPAAGKNKLGVGSWPVSTDTKEIYQRGHHLWENIGDHDYKPFIVNLDPLQSRAHCQCSGGTTNKATVVLDLK